MHRSPQQYTGSTAGFWLDVTALDAPAPLEKACFMPGFQEGCGDEVQVTFPPAPCRGERQQRWPALSRVLMQRGSPSPGWSRMTSLEGCPGSGSPAWVLKQPLQIEMEMLRAGYIISVQRFSRPGKRLKVGCNLRKQNLLKNHESLGWSGTP